jgi:hypothetical protein
MSLTAEMVQVQAGVPGAFERLYDARFPELCALFSKLGFPPRPAWMNITDPASSRDTTHIWKMKVHEGDIGSKLLV